MTVTTKLLIDTGERALWTFAQAFCAAWLVNQAFTWTDAKIALLAGCAAVAKGIVAGNFMVKDSASTAPGV